MEIIGTTNAFNYSYWSETWMEIILYHNQCLLLLHVSLQASPAPPPSLPPPRSGGHQSSYVGQLWKTHEACPASAGTLRVCTYVQEGAISERGRVVEVGMVSLSSSVSMSSSASVGWACLACSFSLHNSVRPVKSPSFRGSLPLFWPCLPFSLFWSEI